MSLLKGYQGSGQAAAEAMRAQVGSTIPVPEKAFDGPAARIEGLVKDGHALLARLRAVNERLLGEEPQGDAAGTQANTGERLHGGVAGQYQRLAEQLGDLIVELGLAVHRAERL